MSVQTPAHPTAFDLRRDLGDKLRVLRLHANLTGKDLADKFGCHPSKISRIEHGTALPSVADVRAWCVHCSAEDQTEDLVAQAVAAESAFSAWRSEQRAGFLRLQQAAGNLYDRTSRFHAYESRLVPGLLQTEAYTRVILAKLQAWRGSPDDVADAAIARYGLRRLLSTSATFQYVIEESALRSRIAPDEVMREQLEQLVADSQRSQVSVGIIPLDVPRERWPVESFYAFDEATVRLQLVSGRLTVTAPSDVAEYVSTFAELWSLAVVGDEARDLIRRAMP